MEAERLIKMIDGIDYSSEYSDDEGIRVNLNDLVDIRESQEFMEASKSFDHYMEECARKTQMTQEVLSEIVGLAAQATKRAMEFCFLRGFEMGNRIMKSFLEEKKENQDLPNTTLPVS